MWLSRRDKMEGAKEIGTHGTCILTHKGSCPSAHSLVSQIHMSPGDLHITSMSHYFSFFVHPRGHLFQMPLLPIYRFFLLLLLFFVFFLNDVLL